MRTLRPGCKRGADVKRAQEMLRTLGYFKRHLGKRYGKAAQEAVRAFKTAHHLPHDRVVGPRTWKALENARPHAHVERKAQPADGFDVSSFQGAVDFKAARKSGRSFVYIKATEGEDFTDSRYTENVKAAKAADLHVGAYHFLRPKAGRSGAVEADWFHKQLVAKGLGKGDLRPVLDVETTALSPADTMRYVGEAVARLRHHGHRPLIYTFPGFATWKTSFGCPLWIAHFGVSKPSMPVGGAWHRYYIWQHSSTATVPGVKGRCDVDKCPDMKALIA